MPRSPAFPSVANVQAVHSATTASLVTNAVLACLPMPVVAIPIVWNASRVPIKPIPPKTNAKIVLRDGTKRKVQNPFACRASVSFLLFLEPIHASSYDYANCEYVYVFVL